MAPEIVEGKPHGKEVDIWAVGILALEMRDQKPPYDGENILSIMSQISKQGRPDMVTAVKMSGHSHNFLDSTRKVRRK